MMMDSIAASGWIAPSIPAWLASRSPLAVDCAAADGGMRSGFAHRAPAAPSANQGTRVNAPNTRVLAWLFGEQLRILAASRGASERGLYRPLDQLFGAGKLGGADASGNSSIDHFVRS
ncbi:MAG TPA: hypothetical protein VJ890_17095 [Vineibacter sp.]|nr:hypothetical protein [Vineibacter sp.]